VIWLTALFDSRLFPFASVKVVSISRTGKAARVHLDGQPFKLLGAAAGRLADCRAKRLAASVYLRHGVLDASPGPIELAATIAVAMATGRVAVHVVTASDHVFDFLLQRFLHN